MRQYLNSTVIYMVKLQLERIETKKMQPSYYLSSINDNYSNSSDLSQNQETNRRQVIELIQMVTELEETNCKLQQELKEIKIIKKEEQDSFMNQIKIMMKTISQQQDTIMEKNNLIQNSQLEYENLIEKIQKTLSEKEDCLEKNQKQINELINAFSELQKQRILLIAQNSQARQIILDLNNQNNNLNEKIQDLMIQFNKLQKFNSVLSTNIQELQNKLTLKSNETELQNLIKQDSQRQQNYTKNQDEINQLEIITKRVNLISQSQNSIKKCKQIYLLQDLNQYNNCKHNKSSRNSQYKLSTLRMNQLIENSQNNDTSNYSYKQDTGRNSQDQRLITKVNYGLKSKRLSKIYESPIKPFQIKPQIKTQEEELEQNLMPPKQQMIDPYYAFFLLTIQCLKLNSKQFNVVATCDLSTQWEYLKQNLPFNKWQHHLNNRLRQYQKRR